jgi:para-nitrobenzyl esterase
VPPGPIDSALAHGPVQPVPVIVGNNADESDTAFGAPARAFARLVTARGVRVYRYVFAYAQDTRGAYHSAEIRFVFDLASPPLAETMSDYWVAFAKTGDPNGGGRPRWPVYDAASDAYLELGSVVAAKEEFRRARYDSLDAVARDSGEVRP